MIEARAFGINIETIRGLLEDRGAQCMGKYKIHDTIYAHHDKSISLKDEFLRLRELPENIWESKPIVVALKRTNLHQLGKISDIPLYTEFDRVEDAKKYIADTFQPQFMKDYSFSRIGWQYTLANGDIADLEIIKGKYHSVEIKSQTDAGIQQLARELQIKPEQFIKGPSVVAVRQLLKSDLKF